MNASPKVAGLLNIHQAPVCQHINWVCFCRKFGESQ